MIISSVIAARVAKSGRRVPVDGKFLTVDKVGSAMLSVQRVMLSVGSVGSVPRIVGNWAMLSFSLVIGKSR